MSVCEQQYSFHRTVKPDLKVAARLKSALDSFYASPANVKECDTKETLNEYYLRTRHRPLLAKPANNSWDAFYNDIGSCDLYRDEALIDRLLHDIATLPVKHVGG